LIKEGGRTSLSEILNLIDSIYNKEKLPDDLKESMVVPIDRRVLKEILVITEV
jgi:hypothetical protein